AASVSTVRPSTSFVATSATSPAGSVLPFTENVFSAVSPAGTAVNVCSPDDDVTCTSIGTVSVFVTDAVSHSLLPAALQTGVAVAVKDTEVEPGSAPIVPAVVDWSNDREP